MNYALASLWHDRSRYLPGVLAVTFSAVLMALQCGLLLGLFSITSLPIDTTRADIWVGSKEVKSVDLGRPVPFSHMARLGDVDGVERIEFFYQNFANWKMPNGSSELCIVIGSSLNEGNLGSVAALSPGLRERLTEPGSVVIDAGDAHRLGITEEGQSAEINNHKVRIVGFITGYKSLAGPYVFCSQYTARTVLSIVMPTDHCTYLLVKVAGDTKKAREALASDIVAKLREKYPPDAENTDMSVFTEWDFSVHSRLHWLTKTKAGIAIGYAALLGLLVGMVVTSQTLYAATTSSAREYAILLALGIPRWRVSLTVLMQSFWVGLFGVVLAYPAILLLAEGALVVGVKVLLPWQLLAASAGITMFMATISGLLALRSVRQIEPMTLLR